jgi:Tfp pilus assembly protein PilF
MKNRRICHFVVLLLLLASTGCARLFRHHELNYQTVSADPNRDTDGAKAENEKAMKALERQRLDKAEKHLQQALICDVAYGPAHNNLGQIYFSQAKYYLAAWEFEYAVKLMPERPEPYNNLGLVYEKVGKLNEAIETFDTGLKLQPNNPELLGNLARARIRRGDSPADLQPLLQSLAFIDTRPEWVAWAKHQLVFPGKTTSDDESLEIIPAPQGNPRTLQGDEDASPNILPKHLPEPLKAPKPDTVTRVPLPPSEARR